MTHVDIGFIDLPVGLRLVARVTGGAYPPEVFADDGPLADELAAIRTPADVESWRRASYFVVSDPHDDRDCPYSEGMAPIGWRPPS